MYSLPAPDHSPFPSLPMLSFPPSLPGQSTWRFPPPPLPRVQLISVYFHNTVPEPLHLSVGGGCLGRRCLPRCFLSVCYSTRLLLGGASVCVPLCCCMLPLSVSHSSFETDCICLLRISVFLVLRMCLCVTVYCPFLSVSRICFSCTVDVSLCWYITHVCFLIFLSVCLHCCVLPTSYCSCSEEVSILLFIVRVFSCLSCEFFSLPASLYLLQEHEFICSAGCVLSVCILIICVYLTHLKKKKKRIHRS